MDGSFDISGLDLSEGVADFHEACDALRDDTLQVPPFKDPVEWATCIDLPKAKSSRPGPYQMNGYQRPVARAAMDPDTDQITVIKGVQVGWSLFLSAMLFYGVSYLAINVTLAQPTDDDAKSYFKDRIEPGFRDIEFVRQVKRVPVRGETQDTWNEHYLTNGSILRLVGAVSDDSFRRYSSKWNMGDEYAAEGWAPAKGSQGSKADLFRARGTDFHGSILWLGSTPLERGSCRITAEWLESDRGEFFVDCPHCGKDQILEWGDRESKFGFKFTRDGKGVVTDCYYQCVGCGERIDEEHKIDMVEAGEFRPTNPSPNRPGHRGFRWPEWLSSAPKAAWKNLAQQFVNAKGNPEAMQVFVNNVKAEPFDPISNAALDGAPVHEQVRNYPAEVPDDVVVITIGGDTQTNKEGGALETISSRELQVVGWTRNQMPRVIGYWIVPGAPGEPVADRQVREIIDRPYRKRNGTEMYAQATAIDMGGHFADETRLFCFEYPASRNVWAIMGRRKGLVNANGAIWPKKVSRRKKDGPGHYTINTPKAKDAVARMILMKGDDGPLFPASILKVIPDYFDKLTCEERKVKNGTPYWVEKRGRRAEEEWVTLAYAYAALKGLQTTRLRWRNLNVAADELGIPAVAHDPETGEILDWKGPDRSAQHLEGVDQLVETLRPVVEAVAGRSAQPEVPKAGPLPGTGVVKRKRRAGGIVRSTYG